MANRAGQKIKLLKVMSILMNETDEEHPLNANEIIERLEEEGIQAERKSIYSDIATLEEYGLDIEKSEDVSGGYYVCGKSFELAELKLMVDAISSSRFISEKKARELADRVAALGNIHDARELSRQVVVANRNKNSNSKVFYAIDTIYRCIDNNHKISFKYTRWDINKKLVFPEDREVDIVSPAALLWFDDNYYLVAYSDKYKTIRYYRVDKMDSTTELDEDRDGVRDIDHKTIADIARYSFGMYKGERKRVTIICDRAKVGIFIDRFGTDITIQDLGEQAKIRMELEVGPQFFGWIAGLGEGIYIDGPEDVKQEYVEHLQNILKNY